MFSVTAFGSLILLYNGLLDCMHKLTNFNGSELAVTVRSSRQGFIFREYSRKIVYSQLTLLSVNIHDKQRSLYTFMNIYMADDIVTYISANNIGCYWQL